MAAPLWVERCPTKPWWLHSCFTNPQWLQHPESVSQSAPVAMQDCLQAISSDSPHFTAFHYCVLPFLFSRVCSQALTTSLLSVSAAAASHMLPPLFSGYTLSLEHLSPTELLLFPTKHGFTPEFQTALQTFSRLQLSRVVSCRKHPLPPGTSRPSLGHGQEEY